MKSLFYQFKDRAIVLRRIGKTYGEIKKITGQPIPKSTLCYWFKGLIIPAKNFSRLQRTINRKIRVAQAKALVANRIKRQEYLRVIGERVKHIPNYLENRDVAKIALSMLYLGEGAKWKGHSGMMLGSSDPDIIRLYLGLMDRCYGIKPGQMKCRICYRADQNIKELQRYWSEFTGISLENFYRTKPDPRTFGKKTLKKEYKGVCVLTCRGSDIQLELEQIIKILVKKL